ncbi:MAG: ATP-grasp domain-containing protein [Actinomycetota bacterium]|nr:ATP-grasp domain-containing protein [Actinomycetota bacterium]
MADPVNVLFTSAGRRIELLRAFRDAYRACDLEGEIVACDVDPLAPALQEADAIHLVPHMSSDDYVDAIVEVCLRHRIAQVFPLIDPDIPVLAAHRKAIEDTGARLMCPPEQATSITGDKLLTYRFFRDAGIPTVRSWDAEEARGAALDFPVFIKPRAGSASEHTYKVRDGAELEFFLGYVPNPVVQEYLPGPEITNDVVSDLEGNVLAVVSRRRIQVRSGEVLKGVTLFDPDIARLCADVARGLDAVGPITVQCMMKDDLPYFTEINPRFGGGVPLGIAAGVDSPRMMLELAAGRTVEPLEPGAYRTGLYTTRFDDSFLVTEEDRARIEGSRLRP